MFNLGFSELIVLGVLALIFIGPKQLPEVARVIGRLLNEFKSATGDLTSSFVKTRDQANSIIQETRDQVEKNMKEKIGLEEDFDLDLSKDISDVVVADRSEKHEGHQEDEKNESNN